ncbi:MAG: SM-like, degradation of cytoplasmic mRNAs and positively regulates transcription initiation [Cirrosporium novae-zelandiae]|nr:MAG: SM-like, degradation of cytoplasmic mRNAs and positively regulates transcription initiation [Cirrosporium novae-zelandiae]
MEHIPISDPVPSSSTPLGGAAGHKHNASAGPSSAPIPQAIPELPPQMFTTAAQLLDLTDTNLVLQDTIERIYATSKSLFADVPRGVVLIRGENVVMLGEIDLDKEDVVPPPYQLGEVKEVFALQKEERATQKKLSKAQKDKLHELGFEGEHSGEVLF